MKKLIFVLVLIIFLISGKVYANPNLYDAIFDNYQVIYNVSKNNWSVGGVADDKIVLTKKVVEGATNYSKYYYQDGTLAFALETDCEVVINGKFIVVDNNLLKYTKVIYDEGNFRQVYISEDEIIEVFPDVELLKISSIDADDKTWLHKPLFKKRVLLLYNDTDKFFHQLTCKFKKVQDTNIKGLITFNRYGIFSFKHYGKYKGKLVFYIR